MIGVYWDGLKRRSEIPCSKRKIANKSKIRMEQIQKGVRRRVCFEFGAAWVL
jgi:hypothetical protein